MGRRDQEPYDAAQARAAAAENKLTARGGWDDATLADWLQGVNSDDREQEGSVAMGRREESIIVVAQLSNHYSDDDEKDQELWDDLCARVRKVITDPKYAAITPREP